MTRSTLSLFRPDAIVWAYWLELLDIEPEALKLAPEYLECALVSRAEGGKE